MAEPRLQIRPAVDDDLWPLAVLFADVAEERDGIATEPPVDLEERAEGWDPEGSLVAVADGEDRRLAARGPTSHGFGEVGMLVARGWRGRWRRLSALLAAAIEWARERGLHKLSLSVFPHNAAAIALYRKFGFVEEGRLVKQYRRKSGESVERSRWDCCSERREAVGFARPSFASSSGRGDPQRPRARRVPRRASRGVRAGVRTA